MEDQLTVGNEETSIEVPMIVCARCGQHKPANERDRHLCDDCVKVEMTRYRSIYNHRHNNNWMEENKANGIDPWLQQPGETNWEYSIWCAYRDMYPSEKASYRAVALKLRTTYTAVMHAATRWSFPARMQEWIAYCDEITLTQRRQEILDMNKSHIDLSTKLRNKIEKAIDNIDPYNLTPAEITSLFKMSADLERKARTDTIAQEEMQRAITAGNTENPELKKNPTKQTDLSEVVGILLKAGALGDITTIGVRETKTTQVVVGDANGSLSGVNLNNTQGE